MKYRTLGRTGMEVSELGFGTAPLGMADYLGEYDPVKGREGAIAALRRALDLGVNFVDTAPYYGAAEEIVGEALAARREEFFLATKVAPCLTSEETAASVRGSLARLGTDVIDVIQVHNGCAGPDRLAEVSSCGQLDALKQLKEEGVVRFIGVTGEPVAGAEAAVMSGEYDVVQVRYNVLYQEADDGLLELAAERGVGIVVMRPLASGNLEKIAGTVDPQLAEKYDWAGAALSFVLSHPLVASAVAGMRTVREVDRNVATAENPIPFDLEDLYLRQHTSVTHRRYP